MGRLIRGAAALCRMNLDRPRAVGICEHVTTPACADIEAVCRMASKPLQYVGDGPLDGLARRAALWTVLCSVSAAPSFFWASGRYDVTAMVAGVALFIVLYTLATSTVRFLEFRNRPFVRRTLYVGYITRLSLSVLF